MTNRKSIAIVGAGFFGLTAALHFAKKGYSIAIYERNSQSMQESSLFNQARVHGGYHYPRSLTTAARCRVNYSRFKSDFEQAIFEDFESLYAIATDSKVNSVKFVRLMEMIGAPIERLSKSRAKDFNNLLISDVYKVQEVAFNSEILLKIMLEQLNAFNINTYFNAEVTNVNNIENGNTPRVRVKTLDGNQADYQGVIITTYGLDKIQSDLNFNAKYMYEVCELIRVRAPKSLRKAAITVMDGPYWSITPWPVFQCQILTHVRHTPHAKFNSFAEARIFLNESLTSRSELIVRDASRYLPILAECEVLSSEYTVKTILKKKDFNDARPIFAQRDRRILSVLGSKVDLVYEVEEVYNNFSEVI